MMHPPLLAKKRKAVVVARAIGRRTITMMDKLLKGMELFLEDKELDLDSKAQLGCIWKRNVGKENQRVKFNLKKYVSLLEQMPDDEWTRAETIVCESLLDWDTYNAKVESALERLAEIAGEDPNVQVSAEREEASPADTEKQQEASPEPPEPDQQMGIEAASVCSFRCDSWPNNSISYSIILSTPSNSGADIVDEHFGVLY